MVYVRVCPRCGSHNVKMSRTPLVGYLGYHTPNVCQNCGFTSVFFPEVQLEQAKKIEVKKWKKPEADTGGSAISKFWFWIILLLFVLPFIVLLLRMNLIS